MKHPASLTDSEDKGLSYNVFGDRIVLWFVLINR